MQVDGLFRFYSFGFEMEKARLATVPLTVIHIVVGGNMYTKEDLLVSVVCPTYNHEQYISETLDSFIQQNVNFKYEIIVRDDASTDNTTKIILQYQKNYPDVIVPVIEKVNQWSIKDQKKRRIRDVVLQYARGKYLAFCEGDDYWSDKEKLQCQVDFMESNPKVVMCCHSNYRVRSKDKRIIDIMQPISGKDGFLSEKDLLSESNFPHLSSIVTRRETYVTMPALFNGWPVGDYPQRAYYLSSGQVFCFIKPMSAYRVMSNSSWSKRYQFDKDYRYNMNKRMDEFLNKYDEYTNGRYHEFIQELIVSKDFKAAVYTGHFEEASQNPCYSSSTRIIRLFIEFGKRFPKTSSFLIRFRTRLKLLLGLT